MKAQESATAYDAECLDGRAGLHKKQGNLGHLSPIRNLAEFYQRKLNKIESHMNSAGNNESLNMHAVGVLSNSNLNQRSPA